MKKSIGVLDTTLRDGAQSASVSYTVKDKLKILDILDALGIGFAAVSYTHLTLPTKRIV